MDGLKGFPEAITAGLPRDHGPDLPPPWSLGPVGIPWLDAPDLRDAAVTEATNVNDVATRMLTADEKQQFITLMRKVIEGLEQDR